MRPTLSLAVLLALASAPLAAQKPAAYPAKGQTAEQKTQDDATCATWAKQDTGIDPAAVAATPPPTTGPQGERLAGAVRGAAAGAVVGEIANDDASDGAKAGAAAGVLAGGHRARRNQAARAQQAQQAQAASVGTYWNAWGACMAGKGYSVQ
jgi:hypothetical protein